MESEEEWGQSDLQIHGDEWGEQLTWEDWAGEYGQEVEAWDFIRREKQELQCSALLAVGYIEHLVTGQEHGQILC